jgi:hypothetical protein
MWEAVKQNVKYWGFLALKLAAGESVVAALLWWINLYFKPRTPLLHVNLYRFGYDLGYTSLVGVCFLLGYLVIYFAVRDQRYRCRVCLRRLRMPVARGSWSMMLQFGRPQMQYICPYGHGKLDVAELQITGTQNPEWTQHGDLWEELMGVGSKDESEQ